MTTWYKGVVL